MTKLMRQYSRHYILDGKTPVPVSNVITWAMWFETAKRTVAHDEINGVRISTVFLGMDHRYGPGPPLIFETMIFGGEHDEYCDRYSTWKGAEAGHKKAIAMVKGK